MEPPFDVPAKEGNNMASIPSTEEVLATLGKAGHFRNSSEQDKVRPVIERLLEVLGMDGLQDRRTDLKSLFTLQSELRTRASAELKAAFGSAGEWPIVFPPLQGEAKKLFWSGRLTLGVVLDLYPHILLPPSPGGR